MKTSLKRILLLSIFVFLIVGISSVSAQEVSDNTTTLDSTTHNDIQTTSQDIQANDNIQKVDNNVVKTTAKKDKTVKTTTKTKNLKTETENSVDVTNDNYDQLDSYMEQYSTINFVGEFNNKQIDVTKAVTITGSNTTKFTNSNFIVDSDGVTISNLNIENTNNANESVIYINGKSNVNINNNNIKLTKTDAGTTFAIEANSTSLSTIDSNNIMINAQPQNKQWINTSATNYIGFVKVSGIVVDNSNYMNITNNNITITNSTTVGSSTSTFEGITIRNESTYTLIRNNILNISNANYTYGISIEKSDRCTATSNTIRLTSENYICGIEVTEDKHTLLNYNNITGSAYKYNETNLIGESFAYGIYLSANYITDMTKNFTVSYNNINLNSNIVYGIEGYKITTTTTSSRNHINYNNITINGSVAMGMGFDTTYRTYIQNNIIKVTGYNRTLKSYYDAVTAVTTGIEIEDSTLSLSNEISNNHILVTENNNVTDTIYAVVMKTSSTVENNYLTSYYNSNTLNGNDAVYYSSGTVKNNYAYDLAQTSNNVNRLPKSLKSAIKSSNATGNTIILNSLTFDDYVTNKQFNDKVHDGDVIDIQGDLIGSKYELMVNKAVNITSTTHDAYFYYNRGPVFRMSKDGSGSNITDLTFYNTRISIEGASNVSINNISYINKDEAIGQTVGGFSIRNASSNVNVTNSSFYTRGNFGHSTVVFAGANNILFENNTVTGVTYDDNSMGRIGNLVYITTYGANGDNYNITIKGNIIDATLVDRDDTYAISTPLRIQGTNITIENNIIKNNPKNPYNTIQEQWTSDSSVSMDSLIMRNNTVDGSVAISSTGSIISNNTLDSLSIANANIIGNTIGSLSAGVNSIIKDNVITNSISISENNTLEGNKINASLTISNSNVNVNNNTISVFDKDYAIVLNGDITNITITNNGLASFNGRGEEAISSNSIEYTSENNINTPLYIIMTNDNLEDFARFDEDEYMYFLNDKIKDNDYILFKFEGDFEEPLMIAFGNNIDSLTIFNTTTDYSVFISLNNPNSNITIINSWILDLEYSSNKITQIYNSTIVTLNIYTLSSDVVLDNNSIVLSNSNVYGYTEYDDVFNRDSDVKDVLVYYYFDIWDGEYKIEDGANPTVEHPVNIKGMSDFGRPITFTFAESSDSSNITNMIFDEVVTVTSANKLNFTNCTFNNGLIINDGNLITVDSCIFNNKGITINNGLRNNITNNYMNLTSTAVNMTSASHNIIKNNNITTTASNTIIVNSGRNNNVTDNYLKANAIVGDLSINGIGITTNNNIPLIDTNITLNINSTEELTFKSVTNTNNLNIKVTSDNETVPNGQVTVYVNDVAQDPIQLVNGEANTTILLNQTGSHFIKVIYNASEYYNNSIAKITYLNVTGVNTATKISPITAKLGESVDINITVSDANNDTFNGSVILTTPDGDKTLNVVNGSAVYNTIITKEWINSNVTAVFQKSNPLLSSSAKISPTVNKGDSFINNDATINTTTNSITIIAQVVDRNNQVIDNGILYLRNADNETLDVAEVTENGAVFSIPLSEGLNYNIKYLGNNYYTATNTTLTAKYVPNLTININNTSAGQNTSITGKLTDENNNPISNATITVKENNQEHNITTDVNGTYATGITAPSIPGTYNVTVNYNGSEKYATTTTTINYTVNKLNTNVTVETIAPIKVGDNVTITGKIIDERNTTVPNAIINIVVGNTTVNTTTNENGTFSTDVLSNNTGTYNVTVTYNGNDKYVGSNTTTNYTVTKRNTITTITPVNGFVYENISLVAHVVDENNNTVNGGYVIFKLNGVTLKDDNGTVVHVDVINSTAVLNTIATRLNLNTTTAVYSGNTLYNSSRTNGTISIVKHNATIDLTVLSSDLRPGHELIAIANITDANGNPVTSGQVTFKLNGVTLKYANGTKIVVDVVNGTARLNYLIPSTYSAKTYKLTAVYGGNTYNRVETSQNITLNKIEAYIEPSNTTLIDNLLHVHATIRNSETNAIASERPTKVSIKINGKTVIKEARVINGIIDLNTTVNVKNNNHTVEIVTSGNNVYNPTRLNVTVSSQKNSIKSSTYTGNSNQTLIKV